MAGPAKHIYEATLGEPRSIRRQRGDQVFTALSCGLVGCSCVGLK